MRVTIVEQLPQLLMTQRKRMHQNDRGRLFYTQHRNVR